MKTASTAAIMFLLLAGCAQLPKNEAKETVSSFGPFFLPADSRLDSITINYFTGALEATSVYFSMVGDADWERRDETPSYFHSMVFKDLEESAVYQFLVHSRQPAFSKRSFIKTVPYGNNYSFDFGLARIGRPLILSKSPHFLVLMSDDRTVSENEFRTYYEKNRNILASTVIVPLFDLEMGKSVFSLSGEGFYFLKYKNACIILLYKDFSDTGRISSILAGSESGPENCFIVASVKDPGILRNTAAYRSRVRAIYTSGCEIDPYPALENITNCMLVTVENREKFALKN